MKPFCRINDTLRRSVRCALAVVTASCVLAHARLAHAAGATVYLGGDDFDPLIAAFPVIGSGGGIGLGGDTTAPDLSAIGAGDTDGDGNDEVYWGDVGLGSGPGSGGCVHRLGDSPGVSVMCLDRKILGIGFADTNGDGLDEMFVLQDELSTLGQCRRTAVMGGDLDGDGIDEVYYGCDDGSVTRSGTNTGLPGCSSGAVRGMGIADMDGDGTPDFVTGCSDGSILINGAPAFSLPGVLVGIAVGDADANGFGDVVAMASDGHAELFHTGPIDPAARTSYQLTGVGAVIGVGPALALQRPCTRANPCSEVKVCTVWNANFIDTGFGEDVAGDISEQKVPAAYAEFSLSRDGTEVLNGNLDAAGCVDATAEALNADGTFSHRLAQWSLGVTSTMTKNVVDQNGQTAPLTIRVQERSGAVPPSTPPETAVPTEPVTVTTSFAVRDGGTTQVVPTTRNDVTAVSAFVSALFSRDDDMGLAPGNLTAYAGQGCPGATTPETTESCSGGANLFIGASFASNDACPDNIGLGDDHWKYTIAHEFGHLIQANFGVSIGATYTPTIGGRPAVCRCDHVTVANQWHCMQSIQRASDSQLEGFAQFYSANMWNSRAATSCAFAYYKEFLVADKPNLPTDQYRFVKVPPENLNPAFNALCSNGAGLPPADGGPDSFYSILPPLFMDCFGTPGATDPREFVNYRTQAGCWPEGQPSDFTTEFDWMKFYMNVTRNPTAAASVGVTQLLKLYASLCNATTPCGGGGTAATATPGWDALRAAAEGQMTADQADAFVNLGSTYGVDRNIPP